MHACSLSTTALNVKERNLYRVTCCLALLMLRTTTYSGFLNSNPGWTGLTWVYPESYILYLENMFSVIFRFFMHASTFNYKEKKLKLYFESTGMV